MRQLAKKMQVAPESLSRAINGNPQLTTLYNIAEKLNVDVSQLFDNTLHTHDLSAIVVYRDKTYITNKPNELLSVAEAICQTIKEEKKT